MPREPRDFRYLHRSVLLTPSGKFIRYLTPAEEAARLTRDATRRVRELVGKEWGGREVLEVLENLQRQLDSNLQEATWKRRKR